MKHIGTYAIWYDTAVPGWVAVNDKQQHSFGNGARGERAAVRHALRAAFPQVAAGAAAQRYRCGGAGAQLHFRIREVYNHMRHMARKRQKRLMSQPLQQLLELYAQAKPAVAGTDSAALAETEVGHA